MDSSHNIFSESRILKHIKTKGNKKRRKKIIESTRNLYPADTTIISALQIKIETDTKSIFSDKFLQHGFSS